MRANFFSFFSVRCPPLCGEAKSRKSVDLDLYQTCNLSQISYLGKTNVYALFSNLFPPGSLDVATASSEQFSQTPKMRTHLYTDAVTSGVYVKAWTIHDESSRYNFGQSCLNRPWFLSAQKSFWSDLEFFETSFLVKFLFNESQMLLLCNCFACYQTFSQSLYLVNKSRSFAGDKVIWFIYNARFKI